MIAESGEFATLEGKFPKLVELAAWFAGSRQVCS